MKKKYFFLYLQVFWLFFLETAIFGIQFSVNQSLGSLVRFPVQLYSVHFIQSQIE